MTIVRRIARLKHPGTFRDFSWPQDLHDLGRFNVIYGWNGSGKTTLSRVFRHLERRIVPPNYQVTLSLATGDVAGEAFSGATIPVRVFNRDFVLDSVFTSTSEVAPILVLGEENVEKQRRADSLKARLGNEQSSLLSARRAAENAETLLERFCADAARAVKEALRSSGQNRYSNYNRNDFVARMQRLVDATAVQEATLSEEDRQRCEAQARASQRATLPLVQYSYPDLAGYAERVADVCARSVVSASLTALVDDPELADWTRSGLQLHASHGVSDCLYCGNSISNERQQALEAHFSAALDQLLGEAQRLADDITAELTRMRRLDVPKVTELYEDIAIEYPTATASFEGSLRSASDSLSRLLVHVQHKQRYPFELSKPNEPPPELDSSRLDELNDLLARHNAASDNFRLRVEEARRMLEGDMVARRHEQYSSLALARQVAYDAVQEMEELCDRLAREVRELEREIVEHRRPAEELNEDLARYLGHSELQLQVRSTGYALTRNGEGATALSEGEMTAISLLYFLKSLEDRRFDLESGIVVLDDPVSSLDANALFLAFGFIRERASKAGQLVLLTHDFAFFRQVKNWFHHLPSQRKRDVSQRPARFFMIAQEVTPEGRRSALRGLDPLLEQFESEYHYLFARVYRTGNAPTTRGLEEAYVLPNVARRLLESFLAFRMPHVPGELTTKVNQCDFDPAKKQRILRFLHTHSHGDAIGDVEHDPSLLAEAGAVCRDLLAFMQHQDPEHYNGMTRAIDQAPEAPDGAA